jgi:hypothetical protein
MDVGRISLVVEEWMCEELVLKWMNEWGGYRLGVEECIWKEIDSVVEEWMWEEIDPLVEERMGEK